MLLWRLGQTPMSTDIYHVNVRFILLPSSYSFNTLIAERDDKFLKMGWGVRHEQRCVFIIFSVNNRKGEKQLRAWIWMWKIARVHFSFLLFPCEKLWLCEIWGGGDFENLCLDSGHTIRVKFIHTCDGSKTSSIYIWAKSKLFEIRATIYSQIYMQISLDKILHIEFTVIHLLAI